MEAVHVGWRGRWCMWDGEIEVVYVGWRDGGGVCGSGVMEAVHVG